MSKSSNSSKGFVNTIQKIVFCLIAATFLNFIIIKNIAAFLPLFLVKFLYLPGILLDALLAANKLSVKKGPMYEEGRVMFSYSLGLILNIPYYAGIIYLVWSITGKVKRYYKISLNKYSIKNKEV